MENSLNIVLRKLRKRNKKTQKEIAEALNITSRAYGNYETGIREPSIDILIKIADYYEISLDILVGRYEKREILEKPKQ